LLRGLGLSAGIAPFLPLLNASGQEAKKPKRLLLIFTPDGSSEGVDWKPQGTETSFTLHPMHAPLEPFKPKLVVPWGLKMSAAGAGEQHAFGMAGLWTGALLHDPQPGADFDGGNGHRTGWGSGPSIDQVVANAASASTPYLKGPDDPNQETLYRTIELGVQCGEPHSVYRMIYKADSQPLHPETSPTAAFTRLFSAQVGDPDALAKKKAEKGAVLDLIAGDIERLRGRVSTEEHPKIDAHLEGIRALERRLDATVAAGCTAPTAPMAGVKSNNATYPAEVASMIDIVSHMFACDLTRVASLQLSRGFSSVVHTWIGMTMGHHTMSHDTSADHKQQLVDVDTWYATQVASLLGKLDAIDEGGSTLLDNTLVVWGRELGTTSHRMQPHPLLMFGGAQGALRAGRFIDVSKEPHAKALVSMAQMMGLDVSTFGNIDVNTGPLTTLA
jgi:hypothetical protein